MSKKINWAKIDKRIRRRRPHWSKEELAALEAGLGKLPDNADNAETIDTPQPAIASRQGGDGDAADPDGAK